MQASRSKLLDGQGLEISQEVCDILPGPAQADTYRHGRRGRLSIGNLVEDFPRVVRRESPNKFHAFAIIEVQRLAIRAVASGQVYLQPALARWLLDDYQRLAKQEQAQAKPTENGETVVGLDILSQREREVLELVGQAWNNQQIGKQLGLSPKTIARHRERIMNKLNMHSRTELVKFAIRTGLIAA